MRFLITRTAGHPDEPPCPSAVRASYVMVDCRNVEDPSQLHIVPDGPAWWYGFGRNHRITTQGLIARDVDEEGWVIDLADMDALLAFVAEWGEVVLDAVREDGLTLPRLEIYDDLRE